MLGWRDSEWTGIAPFLEEDVAFSSIAQSEIGHARAFYELAAAELGTTADELAFDRKPEEYRAAQLVELRLVHDWGATIARRYLYEAADAIRIQDLLASDRPEVAGLAQKIEREEAYHLIHAQMWAGAPRRVRGGAPAFQRRPRRALAVRARARSRATSASGSARRCPTGSATSRPPMPSRSSAAPTPTAGRSCGTR